MTIFAEKFKRVFVSPFGEAIDYSLSESCITDLSAGSAWYIDNDGVIQEVLQEEPLIDAAGKLWQVPSWTQYLDNPETPATQTTDSLDTGFYTLWLYGTGSATLSAGTATITGAGEATEGTPIEFEVTVAGTVMVTVAGTVDLFQLSNTKHSIAPLFNPATTGGTTVASRAGTAEIDLTADANTKLKTALYGTDGSDAAAMLTWDWQPAYNSADASSDQVIFETDTLSIVYDDQSGNITLNDGTTTETITLTSWDALDELKFRLLYGNNHPGYPNVNKMMLRISEDAGVTWNNSELVAFDGSLIAVGDDALVIGDSANDQPWNIKGFKSYDIKTSDWFYHQ